MGKRCTRHKPTFWTPKATTFFLFFFLLLLTKKRRWGKGCVSVCEGIRRQKDWTKRVVRNHPCTHTHSGRGERPALHSTTVRRQVKGLYWKMESQFTNFSETSTDQYVGRKLCSIHGSQRQVKSYAPKCLKSTVHYRLSGRWLVVLCQQLRLYNGETWSTSNIIT